MFAAAVPFIGAGISALGDWWSADSAARGQREANQANVGMARETNAFNAAEAQKSRDFAASMSNSSWQRGVADMKAAGLNPMLAFSKGGASAPTVGSASGAVGSAQLPSNPDYGKGVSKSASSAMDLLINQMSLKKIQSDIDVNNASALKIHNDAVVSYNNARRTTRNTDIDLGTFGTIMEYINRGLAPLSSATGTAHGIKKLLAASPDRIVPSGSVNTRTGEIYNHRSRFYR